MAESLKLCIIDDDEGMRLLLTRIVARAEGIDLAGEAASGEEGLELVERERPDIVFLDVEMPGITGVECARRIQDIDPKIFIIFATAHEQYMKDAFSLYAFDYLIKPFDVERALETLARIREITEQRQESAAQLPAVPTYAQARPQKIMLRHREGISFVDKNEILLVQRENRSTVIYTANDKHTTSESLGSLEERLGGHPFFRCHKSYIINLDAIAHVYPYGRWTYLVKLSGTQQDALMTNEKYAEMEKFFSGD